MSFSPAELADAIRKHIPAFAIDYKVDPVRQSIADSWPRSLDDSAAREDWDWSPRFDIKTMTADMLSRSLEKRWVRKGTGPADSEAFMPTSKLNDVLAKRLETLGQENRLKGIESVICGVIPAR